ncbi:MAG: hypothetical protein WKG07_23645 [Hymenobacter sp.]
MATKGVRPGKKIGTYDAKDVNYAINFLARIVSENNLPPKMLMVHRFTRKMVTNYKNIKLDPRVQVVMDMDGWGDPTLKKDSYKAYIAEGAGAVHGLQAVLRVRHQAQSRSHLMTPKEVLTRQPQPNAALHSVSVE